MGRFSTTKTADDYFDEYVNKISASLPSSVGINYGNTNIISCSSSDYAKKREVDKIKNSVFIKDEEVMLKVLTPAILDYLDVCLDEVEAEERAARVKAAKKNNALIKNVIFKPKEGMTIVLWTNGTKTIVRCQNGEPYDPEKGLAMAIIKGTLGCNTSHYNEIFKKWVKEDE